MKTLLAVMVWMINAAESCENHVQDKPISTNLPGILTHVFQRTIKHHMLTIVYDESSVELASEVSLSLRTHPQMMFTYHQVHTALVPVMENLMEHASLEQMRDQLQFLVVCEANCVEQLFFEVQNLDFVYGQGSLLRHFSTWLIISPDDLHPPNITLDHVAWIRYKEDQPLESQINITLEEIHTLLWMPGRREWKHILVSSFRSLSVNMELYPNIRRGLNGRELVLTMLEWSTSAIREVVNGTVVFTGAGIDLANSLKTAFNFSYVVREPEDKLWGQELENGSFTGILGVMQRKEAHFCPVSYAVTDRRNKVLDFALLADARDYVLVYKRNPDVHYMWLFLVSSYTWPVYVAATGAILGSFLIMYWIGRSGKHDMPIHVQRNMLYFDLIFRISFRQDMQTSPGAMSSRIMIFTLSLFCLVFAALYTSNLVAMLSVHKENVPFNTLKELADHTDYRLVTFEGGALETLLQETRDSTLKKIYKRSLMLTSVNNSFEKYVEDLLTQLLSGSFVSFVSSPTDRILMSMTCEVSFLRKRFFTRMSGVAFPKGSPLLKLFEKQLFALEEMKIMQRWETERLPKAKECEPLIHRLKFTLDHFKSGLVTTGCCITIAGLVLLFEIIRQRQRFWKS